MRLFGFDTTDQIPQANSYDRDSVDSEYTLESWLHTSPGVVLDEQLLIFGRQHHLDAGIPDLLALDQWANVVVIELKKGQSGSGSASEETILGQPQTYAQSLSRYDYEDLNVIYQEYRAKSRDNEWVEGMGEVDEDTLVDAHEAAFGTRIDPKHFNTNQRIVIVAEEITSRTENNARYLLEQGLDVQCVEIQLFDTPDESHSGEVPSFLVRKVVVDYDQKRVKPENQGAPKYPEVAENLIERAFSEIDSIVEANHYTTVMENLESYEPGIRSNAPYHPNTVKYVLHLRPLEWGPPGKVRIDLKIPSGGGDAYQVIAEHADRFRERGFTVTGNSSLFVVIQDWEVESAEPLYDDDFREKVSSRFAELVRTSHDIFEETHSEGTKDWS